MSDRRARFATERVAAEELRGEVEAPTFVTPWPARVGVPSTFLHAAPGGPRDRELMYGDRIELIEDHDGWSFGRSAKDGYCGWVQGFDLGPDFVPTHAVRARHTHLYAEPEIKLPPLKRLPFASRVVVEEVEGRWAATAEGWIYSDHLRPLPTLMPDPVAVAALFLGTPYLWAGNTGCGIDCSGLVQQGCLACGIDCPGDSDQQEVALGVPLAADLPLRRGDLLFWTGHVAWVADPATILHANAHAMAVTYEPLEAALARIEAQGDGPVTSRRRL